MATSKGNGTAAAVKSKADFGHAAALRLLRAKHPTLSSEHEDIAQEAAALAFERAPRDPDKFAVECADRLAKHRASSAGRRLFVETHEGTPSLADVQSAGRVRPRRKRQPAEAFDDEAELRAAVVSECRTRWRKLTGRDWTEEDAADTRERVDSIRGVALDIRAARALFDAAQVAFERLQASTIRPNSPVRVWMRRNVDRMFLQFPLVPTNGERCVDERAALVELLDGSPRANFAYLGRRGKPAEFALVYFLCGYWVDIGPEEIKRRLANSPKARRPALTAASIISAETKRMADQRNRHGLPDTERRARDYFAFVLDATKERPPE